MDTNNWGLAKGWACRWKWTQMEMDIGPCQAYASGLTQPEIDGSVGGRVTAHGEQLLCAVASDVVVKAGAHMQLPRSFQAGR
eukprot:364725-Chlamydomonas_euryale.AAC.2